MKAEHSQLIPRKHTENLVPSIVMIRKYENMLFFSTNHRCFKVRGSL